MKTITTAITALMCTLSAGAVADVVPVVSSDSAIESLARYELTDLFLGKSRRFPDGRPAIPLDQSEDAPMREAFYREFTNMDATQLKAHWSKMIFTGRGRPPDSVDTAEALKQRLAANPNAIGYIDRDKLDERVRVVTIR